MGAFFIASLCVIGLPPFGGFWSKWFLGLGTLEAHQAGMLVVILASSLLSVAYLLPIPVRAFFGTGAADLTESGIREAPAACVGALLVTALGCLLLFFYPDPAYRLLERIFSG
jgi:multicomponent Na+:H+ antiporter subunit D